MRCLVYRSTLYPDMYLFVDREPSDAELPESLVARMGRLEFALEFELTPERRLARTDGATVMASIEAQGFHLQMPPSWP